ncbi:MAG: HAMP domain-containing histidine kinase [Thermodesulfobacteriaceae bacterium]|nr:HAMP domain-containing histidine kinase [Thermodesulfobacteriaceae bacterium]
MIKDFLVLSLLGLFFLSLVLLFLYLKFKKIQKASFEKEEKYRRMEESLFKLPFPIFLGFSSKILWQNRKALEIFGLIDKKEKLKSSLKRSKRFFQEIEIPIDQENYLVIIIDKTDEEATKRAYQLALSYLSHELKTPLTVAKGYIENLESKLKMDHHFNIEFEKVKESLERLDKLIKRIFSALEYLVKDITPRKEEFKLQEIIDEVIFWLTPLCEEKGIKIKTLWCDGDLKIKGDKELLMQAFFNLLENAVKYSPPGEEVILKAMLKNNQTFIISIRDFGPGVEEEDLPFLGLPFFKTKESEGMGLGLFIAKRIIENHKGKMKFRLPGLGFEVEIEIPM